MVVQPALDTAVQTCHKAEDDSCDQNIAHSDAKSYASFVSPKRGYADKITCDCIKTENGAVGPRKFSVSSESDDMSLNPMCSSESPAKCCLKQRCGLFLETGFLSDVTFIVGEGEQRQKFHAHRVFLASGSEVFGTMFCKKWSELGEIEIPDVEPVAFSALLR